MSRTAPEGPHCWTVEMERDFVARFKKSARNHRREARGKGFDLVMTRQPAPPLTMDNVASWIDEISLIEMPKPSDEFGPLPDPEFVEPGLRQD